MIYPRREIGVSRTERMTNEYTMNYVYIVMEIENRILRRIFGPTTDANGVWRRLHNVELHSLYHSPNIVRVIKSRRLR